MTGPQGNRGVEIAGSTDMIEIPEQPANLVLGRPRLPDALDCGYHVSLSAAYEGTRLRAASCGTDREAWDPGERLPEL